MRCQNEVNINKSTGIPSNHIMGEGKEYLLNNFTSTDKKVPLNFH
jgi:hypothetical protein